jgi:hypothetical protein
MMVKNGRKKSPSEPPCPHTYGTRLFVGGRGDGTLDCHSRTCENCAASLKGPPPPRRGPRSHHTHTHDIKSLSHISSHISSLSLLCTDFFINPSHSSCSCSTTVQATKATSTSVISIGRREEPCPHLESHIRHGIGGCCRVFYGVCT